MSHSDEDEGVAFVFSQLLKRKRLSREELARRIGVDGSTVRRWDNVDKLRRIKDTSTLKAVARELDTTVGRLLELDDEPMAAPHLDDVVEVTPEDVAKIPVEWRSAVQIVEGEQLYTVVGNSLENLGLIAGSKIRVKLGATPQPGEPVVIEINGGGGRKSVLLMRQFVPPALYVTNRANAGDNEMLISTDPERDLRVVGVIVRPVT